MELYETERCAVVFSLVQNGRDKPALVPPSRPNQGCPVVPRKKEQSYRYRAGQARIVQLNTQILPRRILVSLVYPSDAQFDGSDLHSVIG